MVRIIEWKWGLVHWGIGKRRRWSLKNWYPLEIKADIGPRYGPIGGDREFILCWGPFTFSVFMNGKRDGSEDWVWAKIPRSVAAKSGAEVI